MSEPERGAAADTRLSLILAPGTPPSGPAEGDIWRDTAGTVWTIANGKLAVLYRAVEAEPTDS